MQIRDQGWECPKCERIWAPKIAACGWCNHRAAKELPAQHFPIHDPGYFNPPWNVTCRPVRTGDVMPEWNFTADDASFL